MCPIMTSSTPELAAEFCRKEIAGPGWREAPAPGAKNFAKEGTTLLRFVQNAMECMVSIKRKGERETEVIDQTYCRSSADIFAAEFADRAFERLR